MHRAFVGLISIFSLVAPQIVAAQELVFVIRHAEKQAGDDPALTEAGRERAARWGEMLQSAGLDLVVTSDATRTRETGAIVAEALGLPVEEVPASETQALVDLLEWDHEDARVLVIGHTETIPGILTALGAIDAPEIGQDDFANLFVLAPGEDAVPGQLRMP